MRIRKLLRLSPEGTQIGKGRKEMAEAGVVAGLDAMSDDDLIDLITEAIGRLSPARFSEVVDIVQRKRGEKEEAVKEALLTEFRERAREMGLSLETLLGKRRTRSNAGQPLPVKYRSPQGDTWSGRGRQPNWLTALEAVGRNKEEFKVSE